MRAEKPLRLMLLPIVPPSAEPMVTPGTLRTAWSSVVAPCDLHQRPVDDDHRLRHVHQVLRPHADRSTRALVWKSSLGREPVTVTGCMVAGAGSARRDSGPAVGASGRDPGRSDRSAAGPWHQRRRAMPTIAVVAGTRTRHVTSPLKRSPARMRRMRVIIMIQCRSENYLQICENAQRLQFTSSADRLRFSLQFLRI